MKYCFSGKGSIFRYLICGIWISYSFFPLNGIYLRNWLRRPVDNVIYEVPWLWRRIIYFILYVYLIWGNSYIQILNNLKNIYYVKKLVNTRFYFSHLKNKQTLTKKSIGFKYNETNIWFISAEIWDILMNAMNLEWLWNFT